MTFYEAALRVLEATGRPLHVEEITELSIAQNLLSHVGKTPAQTMLSRLTAMARRPRDRKLVVTAKDTFALADWAVAEDREALAQTGLDVPNPEESLPPLRPAERHPDPRIDNVRAVGRGAERRRWREEDEGTRGQRRRFPPLAEVAYEILSEAAEPLKAEEIVAKAVERELANPELTPEQVLSTLLEENQHRLDIGRQPQFLFSAESGKLSLEAWGAETSARDSQAALAAALGIPLQAGRPALAKAPPEPSTDAAFVIAVRNAVKEARKAAARRLRQRLLELEVGGLERSVVRMLKAMGFHEFRVVKRMKEGPLFTARRRDGSAALRYTIRTVGGGATVDRRMVQDLRRDVGRFASQLALLASPGELRGEAKSEAQNAGAPVLLWCGDALAEKFLDARLAVHASQFEVFEIDDAFFSVVRAEADEARRRREERLKERQRKAPESVARSQPLDGGGAAVATQEGEPSRPQSTELSADDAGAAAEGAERGLRSSDEEEIGEVEEEAAGEEASSEDSGRQSASAESISGATTKEAAPGTMAEHRRRRRRRRGRRGRGRSGETTRPREASATAPSSPASAAESAPAEPSSPPAEGNGSGNIEH